MYHGHELESAGHRPSPAPEFHRLSDRPIAIVGLSALYPKAANLKQFWSNIVDGTDCIEDVPTTHWKIEDYFDPNPTAEDKTYCRRGGFLPPTNFNPMEFGIPPTTLEVTDVLQLLALVVAKHLFRDAGWDKAKAFNPARTGVILGITGANSLTQPLSARLQTPVLKEVVRSCGLSEREAEEIAARFKKAYIPWEENSFPGMLGNVVAGRIANRFDLGGTNCTVDAACASSLAAIKMAISELNEGRADTMITGGCDAENTILMYMCFSKTPAFSKAGVIRPFDRESDGTLIGEGLGMLALKRLADAERDGDRIYAVIRGLGTSSDGRFKSIYAPREEGQVTALKRAYEDAQCLPGTVGLVEAHGTGTAVGDLTEMTALSQVYTQLSPGFQYAALGSIKSQIGHTKAAAGAAGLIKTALALHHKVLPPTINVKNPNEKVGFTNTPLYVNTLARPWITDARQPVRRAAVSSFGFGGTNFHLVLEEHSARGATPSFHRGARAFLWSAADPEALAKKVESAKGGFPVQVEEKSLDPEHARIGFVARTEADYEELRGLALELIKSAADKPAMNHPRGVRYRRRALPSDWKVTALFAGQGSQYTYMGRTAALANPGIRDFYERANHFHGPEESLSHVVYPPPVFRSGEAEAQEAKLAETRNAQPAIGALSGGQFRVATQLGFSPDACVGHSFGELTALWAARSLSDDDFLKLASARGVAMSPRPANESGSSDTGKMAAISAGLSEVEALLKEIPEVQICNYNSPQQLVVGGSSAGIDRLIESCREKNLTAKALRVSAAFHTRFVAHAVEAFSRAVEQVDFRPPVVPVLANTSGEVYPSDTDTARALLTEQLVQPVRFAQAIEKLYGLGHRVFVEFGPKDVLTRLVGSILEKREHIAISFDAGPAKDSDTAVKDACLHLRLLGLPLVNLNRNLAPEPLIPPAKPGSIELLGINYVSEKRRQAFQESLRNGYKLPVGSTASAPERSGGVRPAASPPSAPPPPPLNPLPRTMPTATLKPEAQVTAPRAGVPEYPLHHHVEPPQPDGAVSELAPVDNPPALGAESSRHSFSEEASSASLPPLYELHRRFMDAQLETANRLAGIVQTTSAASGGQPSDAVIQGLDTVYRHSVNLGEIHLRATEVLARLNAGGDYADPQNGFSPKLPDRPRTNGRFLATRETPAAPPSSPPPRTPSSNGAVKPSTPHQAEGAPRAAPVPTPPVAEKIPVAKPVEPTPIAAITPSAPPPIEVIKAAAISVGAIHSALFETIAEKTGYPPEMLEDTMDLEGDLGIDSIKRVEIFGSLRERLPDLPTFQPDAMGELRTLKQIKDFIAAQITGVDQNAPPPLETATAATFPSTAPPALPPPAPAKPSDSRSAEIVPPAPAATVSPRFPTEVPPLQPSSNPVAPPAAEMQSVFLAILADATGYPVETLNLDMDLESDLGVDSIKRVQIIGAFREKYPEIGAIDPERFGELRTLRQIVDLFSGAGGTTSTSEAAQAIAAEVIEETSTMVTTEPMAAEIGDANPKVGQSVSDETGRTHAVLRSLPAPETMINAFAPGSTAVVIHDGTSTADGLVFALLRQGWKVEVIWPELNEKRAERAEDPQIKTHALASWEENPLATVFENLKSAGRAAALCLYVQSDPTGDPVQARQRLRYGILTAKHFQKNLPPSDALGRVSFLALTRQDGVLGLLNTDLGRAWSGGLSGLVKTLAAENRRLFCRLIDVADHFDDQTLCDFVLTEMSDADPSLNEIGYNANGRMTIGLGLKSDRVFEKPVAPLTRADVLVVTGGGRGVTAHCIHALARRIPCEFVLIGRTALSDTPAWVGSATTERALKQQLADWLKQSGTKPTPKEIQRRYQDYIAQQEIGKTLAALQETGATAHYVEADIADLAALRAALTPWAGRVTGIVHGAGVLADRLIADKTAKEIDSVFKPKLVGLENTLEAVDATGLKHLVLFSSVAGFFGNSGQADYAIANEALNKVALVLKNARPGLHVTSINWGAWEGGMVSEQLKKMFEARGIRLIPQATGAELFADQFTEARSQDVIVVIGPTRPLNAAVELPPLPAGGITIKCDLTPVDQSTIILDHSIGGKPVLPTAVALGRVLHLAEKIRPGWAVTSVNDFKVLKGIVFDQPSSSDEFAHAYTAQFYPGEAPAVLSAEILGPKKGALALKHYRAGRIELSATSAPPSPRVDRALADTVAQARWTPAANLYSQGVLFHGPTLQGLVEVDDRDDHTLVRCQLPERPSLPPAYSGTYYDPIGVDFLLQAALVAAHRQCGLPGLPMEIEHLELNRIIPAGASFFGYVTEGRQADALFRCTITACDRKGAIYCILHGVTVVMNATLAEKFLTSAALTSE